MDFKEAKAETEDADRRWRIAFLEGKATQHSHVIAMLQNTTETISSALQPSLSLK
jgi:hypothetical protein